MWRGHRHKLKELPLRIALKHLLRGEAIEDSFWKFLEPCLSNLNVWKFQFSEPCLFNLDVQFKHSFMVVSSWQMSYLNQAGQAVNTNVLRYNSFIQLVPRVFLWPLSGLMRKIPSAWNWNAGNFRAYMVSLLDAFLWGSKFTEHLLVDRTILKQMQTLTEIKPKA